jgi:hypothetical protein
MAEYKPKHDNQLASDARMNKSGAPQPAKPAKDQGDKFQDAFDNTVKAEKPDKAK